MCLLREILLLSAALYRLWDSLKGFMATDLLAQEGLGEKQGYCLAFCKRHDIFL